MKQFKSGNEDFISFNVKICVPKWIYINLENLHLPSCKNNSQKVSFLITYYMMNHKN